MTPSGPLDLVTVTVVLGVHIPFRKLRFQIPGKRGGDISLADIPDQQVTIYVQQLLECHAYLPGQRNIGCAANQTVLPAVFAPVNTHA